LPHPETCSINAVLRDLAAACRSENGLPQALRGLDQRLLHAAIDDARRLLQAVLCRCARRDGTRPAHDRRRRNMLTACGWIAVERNYCPSNHETAFPLDAVLGLEQGATPAARDAVVRCATLGGSFAEGRGLLVSLTPIRIATATVRAITLRVGQKTLDLQNHPPQDIRQPEPPPRPGDARRLFPTRRTMFIMMDGTGVPCTQADTANVAGKGPDGSAKTRELKVGVIAYYAWLDAEERPVPERGSATHVVAAAEASDFGVLLRRHAISRGYGTAPRVQIVGDGADWIATIARVCFPDAIFTADFYHACQHLHAFCLELQHSDDDRRREYRRLKGILFRHGAQPLIRHLRQKHAATLATAPAARHELAYFEKRAHAMRYGLFRKHGLYIASTTPRPPAAPMSCAAVSRPACTGATPMPRAFAPSLLPCAPSPSPPDLALLHQPQSHRV
jgi:hypothetical protein